MIINTMQHNLTPVQITDLDSVCKCDTVVKLSELEPELFAKLANTPADMDEIHNLVEQFIGMLRKYHPEAVILPIGSPAFMFSLACEIGRLEADYWTKLLFSHTERQSVEEIQPDRSVIKKQIFNHVKWLQI